MSTSNDKTTISRRRLLAAAGGVAIIQAASGERIQVADSTTAIPADPTTVPGAPASPLGARSPFEQPQRKAFGNALSFTPLQDLHGTITPADLHFERHHAGIPAIDPERYELLIHGMVERPMKFSLAELKRFPATTQICFIECSGNLACCPGGSIDSSVVCANRIVSCGSICIVEAPVGYRLIHLLFDKAVSRLALK